MTQHEVSAEPLAWALERLSLRAAAAATDNESSRVATAFAQLAHQVRQQASLQDAITHTIAGQPPGTNDVTGLNALIDAEIRAGVRARVGAQTCIWEECDQLAKYCADHAAVTGYRLHGEELEKLRAFVDVVRELWEEINAEFAAAFRAPVDSEAELHMVEALEKLWNDRGRELGRKLGASVPDKPTNTGG